LRLRRLVRPGGRWLGLLHAGGPRLAHFGGRIAGRGRLASHASPAALPLPLHVADGLRAAALAERSHRRDADGIPSLALLHRLLLVVHARPIPLGLHEPPLDGRDFRCDLRGETLRPHGPFQPSDRSDPPWVGRRGGGGNLRPDVKPDAARIPTSTGVSTERTPAFRRFDVRAAKTPTGRTRFRLATTPHTPDTR